MEMCEIKLFLTDVDGCLTDGGMYYSDKGEELKRFCTYDGFGIKLLQQKGIKCGILTSEKTSIVLYRARKLALDYLYLGVGNQMGVGDVLRYAPAMNEPLAISFCTKLEAAQQICSELHLSLQQVCYVGDDLNDVELLQAVGLAACPTNARNEIKNIPNILHLQHTGGNGAIRELCDMILQK